MSLAKGFSWSFKDYHFTGYSVAGQTTSMVFQNAKICFDIAQGLPFHLASRLFCLTHLHSDHGSGLVYLLSQRSLFQLPTATIMLPAKNVASVERIIQEWQHIEGFQYDYRLIPVEAGTRFELGEHYIVHAFPTVHRIDSFGYVVYERKKRLRADLQSATREQLIELRRQGVEIEEVVLHPAVAFTGDTQIEFIQKYPDILKADLLFLECTYLDSKRTIEQTRHWGHTHLDEIVENLPVFQNEHLSFIHLSARYSTAEAEKILQEKLPLEWRDKVSLFPRPH